MTRSACMKLLVLFLALIMTVSLFACNDVEEVTTADNSSETATETETGSETDGVTDTETETETGDTDTVTEPDTNTETDTEPDSETESETEEETETFKLTPDQCKEHAFRTKNGKYRCNHCGYVPECNGDHPYITDNTGHWRGECDKCGKEAGKPQDHEYAEKVEDEGDLLLYVFRCTVCRHVAYEQEVPYEINSFYSAGDIAYSDVSGLKGEFGFDSGVGFGMFSSEDGGTMKLTILSGGEAEEPSGRYLVMKLRLAASQSSFSANIRSVSSYSGAGQAMTFTGIKGGWVTVIVDITKAASLQEIADKTTGLKREEKVGYQPDASGDYYLADFSIRATAGEGEHVDVAYVMFCDTIEDAKSFTENEKVIYTYNDILNEDPVLEEKPCVDENGNLVKHDIVDNGDGTHTIKNTCFYCGLAAVENEPHTYVETSLEVNGETRYTYWCSVCNSFRFGEGAYVNKYFDASQINSMGHSYYQMKKEGLTEEDGLSYATYSGQDKAAQIIFVRKGFTAAEEASAFNVGKAKIFVIRMKVNDTAIDFNINFGSATAEKTTTFKFPVSIAAADEWVSYAVDLAEIIPNSYVADPDGTYTVQNFYFHINGFKSTQAIDVDFMAFVEDWAGVEGVVSDETCVNVTGAGNGVFVSTEGRKCIGEHTISEDPVITDGENGSKIYAFVCSLCKEPLNTLNVPSNVTKFYLPTEYAKEPNVKFRLNAVSKFDNGDMFTHVTGTTAGDASQLIFQRAKADQADASTAQQYTVNVGKADYLVFRARTNDTTLDVSFVLSTDQFNGKVTIPIPVDAAQAGEWKTYIINLDNFLGTAMQNPNGEYVIDTFYNHFEGNGTTQKGLSTEDYFDISHVTFVSGELKDIAGVTPDTTVISITDKSRHYDIIVNLATGEKFCDDPAKHEVYYANEDGHWKDACAAHGEAGVPMTAHTWNNGKCDVCGHPTTCNGTHTYKSDAAGHWKNACAAHSYAGEAKAAHTFEDRGGVPTCKDCGYAAECKGVHTWNDDGATHSMVACPHCGTAAVSGQAHVYSIVFGESVCFCGKKAGCTHAFTSDANGHSMAACPTCGAEAVTGQAHVWQAAVNEEGKSQPTCMICKYKSEAANIFLGADELVLGNSSKLIDLEKLSQDGLSFVRYSNIRVNKNGWCGVDYLKDNTVVSGQYLIIKLRIGNNGLNTKKLQIYANANSNQMVAGGGVGIKVVEDGQWHTVVVDLSTRTSKPADTWTADGDGTYTIKTLNIRPLHDQQKNAAADDYMDIAYIAMCDSLEDIKGIVGETTYEWSMSDTLSAEKNTSDNKCAEHVSGTVTSSGTDPITYTASCTLCGEKVYEKTVPAYAKLFYMPSSMATSFTLTDNTKDPEQDMTIDQKLAAKTLYKVTGSQKFENGEMFARWTGQDATGQVLWQRTEDDVSTSTAWNQIYTMDAGNSKYFVMKLRTNNPEQTIDLNISTTAKSEVNADTTTDPATPRKDGCATIRIPVKAVTADGWATYVVDLETLIPDFYIKDATTETYKIDTFYFHMNSFSSETNVDIAYMTFVDGEWDAVAGIVDQDEVISVTSQNASSYKVLVTETGLEKTE